MQYNECQNPSESHRTCAECCHCQCDESKTIESIYESESVPDGMFDALKFDLGGEWICTECVAVVLKRIKLEASAKESVLNFNPKALTHNLTFPLIVKTQIVDTSNRAKVSSLDDEQRQAQIDELELTGECYAINKWVD